MKAYQLKILDPRKVSAHPDCLNVSNDLYAEWKKIFTEVVETGGGLLEPDDYFRNNFALIISEGKKIVGFSLCTEFDLQLHSNLEHHYWQALNPSSIVKLREMRYAKIMSMEYLTVLPEWRKNPQQIPWAEVLVGLGLCYQDQFPLDAMIGTPRVDLRMGNICESMGGIPIQEPIQKMNYPCAVQIFPKVQLGKRTFPNETSGALIRNLWENRLDFRISNTNVNENQKAA